MGQVVSTCRVIASAFFTALLSFQSLLIISSFEGSFHMFSRFSYDKCVVECGNQDIEANKAISAIRDFFHQLTEFLGAG